MPLVMRYACLWHSLFLASAYDEVAGPLPHCLIFSEYCKSYCSNRWWNKLILKAWMPHKKLRKQSQSFKSRTLPGSPGFPFPPKVAVECDDLSFAGAFPNDRMASTVSVPGGSFQKFPLFAADASLSADLDTSICWVVSRSHCLSLPEVMAGHTPPCTPRNS